MAGLNIEWGCQMPPDIAASDIAVLKTELSAQSKAISDLTRNTERLLALTTSIARMQERMEQHADGLDRAFSLIEKLNAKIDALEKKAKEDIAEVSDDVVSAAQSGTTNLNNLRAEVSKWVNFGKGAWATASFLWLLIAFLFARELATLESNVSSALNNSVAVERRVAPIEYKMGLSNGGKDGGK